MNDHSPIETTNQPYDVFLSHNSKDKPAVESLAVRLADEARIKVWLDKWNLIPGEPWQEGLEDALNQSRTCAVFIGPTGLSPWNHEEMRNALQRRVRQAGFRVIPVLLPGATMPERGLLPSFLSRLTWVDFRAGKGLQDDEAFHRLVCGIKGVEPGRGQSVIATIIECPYRGLEVFDEEHARLPKPAPPSPVTEPPVTTESAAPPISLPGSQAETAKKPSTRRSLLAGAALLVVAIASLAAWFAFRPKAIVPASPPAPERLISFSLTVQKMRDGREYQAPFEASGQEIFESGYKFRLNFSSPQAGWLYLLNEGPTAGGAISYVIVFPIPSLNGGSAQLAAGQAIQTGWYLFTEHEGTEKFWLVWAAQPVGELEAVKGVVNPKDKGLISDPNQLNAVRALLNQYTQAAPEAVKDKVKEQTNVRGRGETLIHLVELKHH